MATKSFGLSRRTSGEHQGTDSSMAYFAGKLQQHLDEIVEYKEVSELPTQNGESVCDSREHTIPADVGIKLMSLSTKEVIVNRERTAEDVDQKDQRKIALNWIEAVKKGKFKENKKKRRKIEENETNSVNKPVENQDDKDSDESDDDISASENKLFQSVAVMFVDGKLQAFKPD